MHRKRLVTGLAVAFGVMTAILAAGGLVNSALWILVPVFGLVTFLLYRHASGRLLSRVYRGVERQAARNGADPGRGGFGAGPREEWTPPGEGRRGARRGARVDGQRRGRSRRARAGRPGRDRPTRQQAYDVLDVEPGADERTVRDAYRRRIKEVHPDTDGGDEDEFKRVQKAYEVLVD